MLITNRYSFSYDSADNEELPQYPAHTGMSKSVQIDQDASWPLVLREFTTFLSAIYGYDVTKSVLIKTFNGWENEDDNIPLSEYE